MSPPPPDLSTLLARPPRGVVVRRSLDRIEVRLLKASWLQQWGMFLPIGEVGSRERRTWWALRAAALLTAALLPLLLGVGVGTSDSRIFLAVLWLGGAVLLLSGCAAAAMLTALLDRLLESLRPCRIALTAQRLQVEELGAAYDLPLDAIQSIAGRADRGGDLGALNIEASKHSYLLLNGARTRDLRWLVRLLEAASQQRRVALLAAGHEEESLSQPPPEAAALRAMTEQAGDGRRSGL